MVVLSPLYMSHTFSLIATWALEYPVMAPIRPVQPMVAYAWP